MTSVEADVLDPDVEGAAQTSIALRNPAVPPTLAELAARKGEALEIIEARVQVLETLRKAAIRSTHPEDWVLFKAPDDQGGQVVGYLQDAGCDRVRDLYGIEIFDIGHLEKIAGADAGVFTYIVSGSGRCKLTRQVVEAMEGGRSSTDDFCKGKAGAELELTVRKAARANLDGNITRELAGMKSVPLPEIQAAWSGTNKTIERCRRGRGFGSRDERLGATRTGTPDVDPPVCVHCGAKGVYRPGKDGRGPFYGCPQYQKHADKKWTVDAAKWIAEQQQKTAQPAASAPAEEGPAPTFTRNDRREPGAEG
jgi:hypothetical protein